MAKIRLMPYDPRWGKIKTRKAEDGTEVHEDRYPMRWGKGYFDYREIAEGIEQFVYQTKKRLLVMQGTIGSTIVWRQFNRPDKYARAGFCSGKKEIARRAKKYKQTP